MTNQELINKIVIETEILKKVEKPSHDCFCDFCGRNYMDGLYWRDQSTYEYPGEDWYNICGKCLLEMSCKFPFLHGINLMMKIDDIQPTLRVILPY